MTTWTMKTPKPTDPRPAKSGLERRTIYPIPADERHGRARDPFTLWFGSNLMALAVVSPLYYALATTKPVVTPAYDAPL